MRSSTALLLFVLPLLAGEAPEEVSGKRALEILKTLSDDSFGGRKSGLASGKKAEEWMAGRLKEIGLQPGYKGRYFHDFKASVTEDGPGALFLAHGGNAPERKGSYLTDYVTKAASMRLPKHCPRYSSSRGFAPALPDWRAA